MAIININESVNGTPLEGAFAFMSEHQLLEVKTNDAVIKPGRLCTRDGSDRKVKLPTTSAEVRACRGVTELTDTQKLNTSGDYPVGTRLSIIRKGVVYMKLVAGGVQGGPVYCYYGAGDTTLRGRLSGVFVDGENALLPGAKMFTTQPSADGMAAVEFDLPGDSGNAEFGTNGYLDVVVDLASIAAASAPDISTAVTGALSGDVFTVTALTALNAGLVICDARCRVDGTVVWRVANVTGGALDPASNTFRFALVSRA